MLCRRNLEKSSETVNIKLGFRRIQGSIVLPEDLRSKHPPLHPGGSGGGSGRSLSCENQFLWAGSGPAPRGRKLHSRGSTMEHLRLDVQVKP